MSECQACARKTDLYLCGSCTADLQRTLTELPWWLARLSEAALGQTRMGDGGRRQQPEGIVRYADERRDDTTGQRVGDENLQRDIDAGKLALDKILRAAGINTRAADLYAEIHGMLTGWVRVLTEERGVDTQIVRNGRPSNAAGRNHIGVSTTGELAVWLAQNVSAVALCEAAGECVRDVRNASERIERAVNRPVPMRFLGKCPTWDEQRRAICGVELRCPADALEVFCRACRQTHNPDRLQLLMMNDLEREKLTVKKILELNRILPQDYRIPERTLRHWRQHGKLRPCGYRRGGPDGPLVITRHSDDDEPVYRWADVRRLRGEGKVAV